MSRSIEKGKSFPIEIAGVNASPDGGLPLGKKATPRELAELFNAGVRSAVDSRVDIGVNVKSRR